MNQIICLEAMKWPIQGPGKWLTILDELTVCFRYVVNSLRVYQWWRHCDVINERNQMKLCFGDADLISDKTLINGLIQYEDDAVTV